LLTDSKVPLAGFSAQIAYLTQVGGGRGGGYFYRSPHCAGATLAFCVLFQIHQNSFKKLVMEPFASAI
jgi:hypothetical protein